MPNHRTVSIHYRASNKWCAEFGLSGSSSFRSFVVTGSIEGNTRCVDLEQFFLEDGSCSSESDPHYRALGFPRAMRSWIFTQVKRLVRNWVVTANIMNYSKILIDLWQNMFSASFPVGYRASELHSPWAVKFPIEWVESGLPPNWKPLCASLCTISLADTE